MLYGYNVESVPLSGSLGNWEWGAGQRYRISNDGGLEKEQWNTFVSVCYHF